MGVKAHETPRALISRQCWLAVLLLSALSATCVVTVSRGLAAPLFLSVARVAPATSACLPTGDVDGDGRTTPADVLLVFQHYLTQQSLAACARERGDVVTPGNGLTPGDAQCILQVFLDSPSCFVVDSDQDGLPDIFERILGRDPENPDTDGDGLADGAEDSDDDGLLDGEEVGFGTEPLVADTDLDGWSDGFEIGLGSDPLNPASQPRLFIAAPAVAAVAAISPGVTVAVPPITAAVLTLENVENFPASVTVVLPPVLVIVEPSGP